MSQYPQKLAPCARFAQRQAGFTMIEVLITFIILVVGLLGLIGLQVRSQQAEMESYQRGQALVLMQDMIDRPQNRFLGTFDDAGLRQHIG